MLHILIIILSVDKNTKAFKSLEYVLYYFI